MEFTKYPADTFSSLVIGAGVLLTDFDPVSATLSGSDILGATTGGIAFSAVPKWKDFGEDIDNVPKNTMELKRIQEWEARMSGTLIAVNAAAGRLLAAAADLNAGTGKITPRGTVKAGLSGSDFRDLWLVADYSDKNDTAQGASPAKAGYVAIRMMNALSTGGFRLQTADRDKGKFEFEFTAHYGSGAQDTVPFEVYIKPGTGE
ncbi:MAG: hypothetical protein IKE30_07315 [Clostridia bacterium]|nr:hypothetical protein [Clostridia bacterium]